MNDDKITLADVELYFPLSMMKEAIVYVERDEYTTFESTCILPTLEETVNLTATKNERHFKIRIDKLCFFQRNGVHECILDSVVSSGDGRPTATSSDSVDKDTQTVQHIWDNECVESGDAAVPQICHNHNLTVHDVQNNQTSDAREIIEDATETMQPQVVKRKRGRPRKSDSQKKFEETLTPSKTSCVQDELSSVSATTVTATGVDKCDEKSNMRYSLRGRKLNSRLMAVEKGSEYSDEDGVMENISDGDDDDDFSPNYESENETSVKSHSRTAKNIVKEKLSESKENIEAKNSRKRINEEIIAILSESNCTLLLSNMKQNIEVTCKICDQVFRHSSKLLRHVENQHSNIEESKQYLKELNELNMIVCDVCSEKFEDPSALSSHLLEKHEVKIDMKCPRCDFIAKNWSSLKVHVRNMHLEVGIKRAFCHLCTASFRSHGSLKQHIDMNHLGNKHVECGTCNKKFYNRSQLRRHSKIHGLDLSKRFFCKVCNKSFMFEYNLKRHMGAVHQTQTESFHCSYCGKGFSQKTPMISHVQLVHFNLFPYSCKVCKCSFPRAGMLKEHMMCVHGQPDYHVPVMPKNSLYDKTDDDKFYCSYCSSGFVHKIRLIEHMHKDHADAFPYKCDICVQGFLEKSFLQHHSVKVHGTLIPADEGEPSEHAGQIMQIITTRSGCPSKIMQTVEVQNTDNMVEGNETMTVVSPGQDEAVSEMTLVSSNETVTAPDSIQSEGTSLLVEVDSGTSTYRYVIEAPNTVGQLGSEVMVQDIANLLLAAKQNTPEEWTEGEYAGDDSNPVQEVSLIINERNQMVVQESDEHVSEHHASVLHKSEPHESEYHESEQTVEVTYDESGENVNQEITNQELPMEVVIDPNEEHCITFSVENQAEPLNVVNGDIIEFSDKSDGTNYYKIINVVDSANEIQ